MKTIFDRSRRYSGADTLLPVMPDYDFNSLVDAEPRSLFNSSRLTDNLIDLTLRTWIPSDDRLSTMILRNWDEQDKPLYTYMLEEEGTEQCKPDYIKKVKRKAKNTMKINTYGNMQQLANYITDFCFDMSLNFIKNKFGKEYFITPDLLGNGNVVKNAVINNFLKRIDKNFKKHTSVSPDGDYHISNSIFLIKLKYNTFVLVKTGNMIKNFYELGINIDDIYLYIFGKQAGKYIKILDKIIKDSTNRIEMGIYSIDKEGYKTDDKNTTSLSVLYNKFDERDAKSLFYSHNEIDIIMNHIDRFLDNESFYKEKQILYKTGILLYGKPGTGKSTIVKVLASKYCRSIAAINVSNIGQIDLDTVTKSINIDEFNKFIILLEDIDTLFLNRNNTTKEENAVINKLLQFLDSNTSPNNAIFIATTNDISKLDSALLREGRFDLKIEIQELNRDDAFRFCKSFNLSDERCNEIIDEIEKELLAKNTDNSYVPTFNQSLLQARCLARLENKSNDYAEALYNVEEVKHECDN